MHAALEVADRIGLTTRQIQDLRLRAVGPQIVQRGLSTTDELVEMWDVERCETTKLIEQVVSVRRHFTGIKKESTFMQV